MTALPEITILYQYERGCSSYSQLYISAVFQKGQTVPQGVGHATNPPDAAATGQKAPDAMVSPAAGSATSDSPTKLAGATENSILADSAQLVR